MLFYVFLVRARFGPKTGGSEFRPPPLNEKRWKKCLMKLGLRYFNILVGKFNAGFRLLKLTMNQNQNSWLRLGMLLHETVALCGDMAPTWGLMMYCMLA